jgi:hypothetical protein
MDLSNITKLYVVNNEDEVYMVYTSKEKAEEAVRILKELHGHDDACSSDDDSDDEQGVYFEEVLEGQSFGPELRKLSECIFFQDQKQTPDVKLIEDFPELNHVPRGDPV